MLEAEIIPHRQYLLAHTAGQKLFLALKVRPTASAATARPRLAVVFVVDTSGSMREVVTEPTERTGQFHEVDGKRYEIVSGGRTKIDLVIAALQGLLTAETLRPDDRLALVKFDDRAEVLVPFTPVRKADRLRSAVDQLRQYSGGTQMGAGMREGLRLLEQESGSRRMVVLTDGQTFDEDLVRQVTGILAERRIPVTAIGVGDDWNENLLTEVTDRTQGKPFHIVPDHQNPQPPSVRVTELPLVIARELAQAANEVVTDIALTVRMVAGVSLRRVTRVYPTVSDVDLMLQPHPLGNAAAGDWTVFLLEFDLPSRPPVRVRLAQLGLTYRVPGANYTGELPPLDVIVEFTQNEALAAQTNGEVMAWVQQRNLEALIREAAMQAQRDPGQAQKTLELARAMTVRLGNQAMTQALDRALQELGTRKTISPGTAKTLRVGAKTQTMRLGEGGRLTDEEIRRITGA